MLLLLAETIEEASVEVETLIGLAASEHANRRKEALQLVSYNLTKFSSRMTASRRILTDLRTLRRCLLAERAR